MYASFNGIEIPNVAEVDVARRLYGETAQTAGGKLRRDIVAVKRIWTIRSIVATLDDIKPLLDNLESTLYAEGLFWLKEFGNPGNSVLAMVDPESLTEQIGAFKKGGKWHVDGRSEVVFVIEEV